MVVHPINAKVIKQAKKMNRGALMQFTPGEVQADLNYHDERGGNLNGGSLWSWIRNKATPWVKKNWNVIKPIVSLAADAAIPAVAAAVGQPGVAVPARAALKQFTGVGVGKSKVRLVIGDDVPSRRTGTFAKGSQEAKDHMAALRAMKATARREVATTPLTKAKKTNKTGGSFRIN
jgi:hypothetical protein